MKRKYSRFLMILLAVMMLFVTGCTTNSSQITVLDRPEDQTLAEMDNNGSAEVAFENSRMTLPENGIVTQEQMAYISGKDGTFEFYSTDMETDITYVWTYEGKKVQNPIEQNMKVEFPSDNVEEVKKAANNASVGLGVKLAKANLAGPAKLTLTLPEKWDADTTILCKLVDGVPQKMCDVSISSVNRDNMEYTVLTFSVTEMGDTYYVVGGKTKVSQTAESGESSGSGSTSGDDTGNASGSSSSGNASGSSSDGNSSGSSSDGNASDNSSANNQSSQQGSGGNSGGDDTQQEVHTCTISIECSTILNNWDDLNKAKSDFVPSDGWILYASTVEYTPGETVYDVLYRVCRETNIHMEASYTPAYSSYYVEGINQLYEFDCGSLSGWMYSVNGWFPNYGCSKYEVSDGDVIEWRYTCDLGRDVGDQYYD